MRRTNPAYSDDAVYRQFVRKFGQPAEVAAGYTDEAASSARGAAVGRPHRALLVAGLVTSVLIVAALVCLCAWRGGIAGAGEKTTELAPPAAIHFDLETMVCAGKVVSMRRGLPELSRPNNPDAALGFPDCIDTGKQTHKFFALGRGGKLIVEFTDRCSCDGEGADLAIFEVGLGESVEVFVSEDAQTWASLGITHGGLATLDLAAHGLSERRCHYVRLVDSERQLADKPAFWGADIDAVVAIHATGGK